MMARDCLPMAVGAIALAGCSTIASRVAGWSYDVAPIPIDRPDPIPQAPSRKPDAITRTSKATDTPRADLFRAIDAWNAALDAFGVKAPRPNLRIATAGHWILQGGGRAAVAVRFEDGTEAVYLSQDYLMSGTDMTETLQHEAAHILAWREHGEDIPEHGTHWQSVCLSFATRTNACRATATGMRFK